MTSDTGTKPFSGKVVVVTGAGSGIGAATVRRFTRDGAAVVLCGRRKDMLDAVAASCEGATLAQPGDVSSLPDMERLAQSAIDRFGRIDVLVNNAGFSMLGGFLDHGPDEWRKVMGAGIEGVFNATRSILPHLVQTRGNVVNVSSVSGLGGDWGMSFLNASKGAVTNLTRSLALEFGSRGVRVNAVNPGLTLTEATSAIKQDAALMVKVAERIPLGRGAEPEEVADVIAFLAGEDARFVTGVNLPVDGGSHASNGLPNFLEVSTESPSKPSRL